MKKTVVFLADGFEEIEGLTVVDLLRRADIEVTTVSIQEGTAVTGSHGITVQADCCFADGSYEEADLLVLPGGMPGTLHLGAHEGVKELLARFHREGRKVAAICAAPSVLGELGILEGKRATCYPGFEEKLSGAQTTVQPVEVDGNVTTSRGLGTAIPFALSLIGQLAGGEKAREIGSSIIYNGQAEKKDL